MRRIFIFLIFFILPVYAYPNSEMGIILKEKYPNADFQRDIILRDDGNGVYIAYSSLPIPDEAEMESLWQQVQLNRTYRLQNETIANRIKANYTASMSDLDTIKNAVNPTEAQQNWAIKREAEILQDILRFLRWIFWY